MKKIIAIFTVLALSLISFSGCEEIATWKLSSESLRGADSGTIVFEGEAMLNGWGVEVPYYTGAPELHFHVSADSIQNLPKDVDFYKYDYNFKLENDEEFLQFLGQSTSESKAEVRAVKITIPQEGHPLMKIKGYSQVVQ